MLTWGQKGKGSEDFEAAARRVLLKRMVAAWGGGDRGEADRCLVEANHWLTTHPDDTVIGETRDRLRATFPRFTSPSPRRGAVSDPVAPRPTVPTALL
jgi:hypothetical protein